jgi:hypothetical protein
MHTKKRLNAKKTDTGTRLAAKGLVIIYATPMLGRVVRFLLGTLGMLFILPVLIDRPENIWYRKMLLVLSWCLIFIDMLGEEFVPG